MFIIQQIKFMNLDQKTLMVSHIRIILNGYRMKLNLFYKIQILIFLMKHFDIDKILQTYMKQIMIINIINDIIIYQVILNMMINIINNKSNYFYLNLCQTIILIYIIILFSDVIHMCFWLLCVHVFCIVKFDG